MNCYIKINKFSRLIAVAKYSNDAAQLGRTESLQWRLWQPLYGPLHSPCYTVRYTVHVICMYSPSLQQGEQFQGRL